MAMQYILHIIRTSSFLYSGVHKVMLNYFWRRSVSPYPKKIIPGTLSLSVTGFTCLTLFHMATITCPGLVCSFTQSTMIYFLLPNYNLSQSTRKAVNCSLLYVKEYGMQENWVGLQNGCGLYLFWFSV
jgi:hypothetical protein